MKQGDIIKLKPFPTPNHAHALVVSVPEVTEKTGFALLMPILETESRYPAHVRLASRHRQVRGEVQCQFVRSFDMKERAYEVVDEALPETISACVKVLQAMVYYP